MCEMAPWNRTAVDVQASSSLCFEFCDRRTLLHHRHVCLTYRRQCGTEYTWVNEEEHDSQSSSHGGTTGNWAKPTVQPKLLSTVAAAARGWVPSAPPI